MVYYREQYTFNDAVETLTAIAEIEGWEDPLDLHVDERAIPEEDKGARERAIDWLQEHDRDSTRSIIRRIFRVIHDHLEQFAQRGAFAPSQRRNRRRVRSMMVLVGEAAQKIDRFVQLFHGVPEGTITGLEEYRELQRFYLLNLAIEQTPAEIEEEPHFKTRERMESDLDRLKHDHDYELLYLRGQDGQHYITPGLEQTIKLACDFSMEMDEYLGPDPLIYLQDWKDHLTQLRAVEILRHVNESMNQFLAVSYGSNGNKHEALLNKAIVALRLAANPRNLLRHYAGKTCHTYFGDFVRFLREALESRGYGELITKSKQQEDPKGHHFVTLIHQLCQYLFTSRVSYDELQGVIHDLIREGELVVGPVASTSVFERLRGEFYAVSEILKRHPSGPLFKALDLIRERETEAFDPMQLGNYPDPLYELHLDDYQTTVLRLPTPTHQTQIDGATVIPEFLGFLRALRTNGERQLLISHQDRTSWRELARSEVLEGMPDAQHLDDALCSITIPKDTDFYYQTAFFRDEDRWQVFSGLLRNQIESNEMGFYFPEDLREELLSHFFDASLEALRRLFFGGAHTLERAERRDLIEMFQMLLELKVIDILQPDICSYVSKDGIDTVVSSSMRLFIGLKLLRGESLSEADWMLIREQLFIPAFLVRERAMMQERWERFLSVIQRMEEGMARLRAEGRAHHVQEELAPLFESNILGADLVAPRSAPDVGPLIL